MRWFRRSRQKENKATPDDILPLPDGEKYAHLKISGQSDDTVFEVNNNNTSPPTPEFEEKRKPVQLEFPGTPASKERAPSRRLF